MRTLTFSLLITIDGFYAGPNGELDWIAPDDEMHDVSVEQLVTADTLLYGRVMHQVVDGYWSTVVDDPSLSESERAFARVHTALPKVVFSRTLDEVGDNAVVVCDNIKDEVTKLKQQPGKRILAAGGSELLATFEQLGLIDDYELFLYPVVIGAGKALFGELRAPIPLNLVESRPLKSGILINRYVPSQA